jgi:hypothetical protein
MTYYYTCGVHYDNTTLATCLRSETEFQMFDDPHNYTQITRIVLSKERAEKKLNPVLSVGAKRSLEDVVLRSEMKTGIVLIEKR